MEGLVSILRFESLLEEMYTFIMFETREKKNIEGKKVLKFKSEGKKILFM